MTLLDVYILKQHAGVLRMVDGSLAFAYDSAYSGPSLSVAMPFSSGEYRGRKVEAWFANVLPDRDEVRAGMADASGAPRSTFGMLACYGLDLPGAVQVVGAQTAELFASRQQSYSMLSPGAVGARLAVMLEDERRSAVSSWTTASEHWSLGGNQAKLALREFNGSWFACEGDGASNVIVKPGIGHFAAQALDECVTMRLAKRCGLPCADCRMETFAGVDAIVVERYDRITNSEGAVARIHQEDFCQALSCMPDKKYAEDGGPAAPDIMTLLLDAYDNSRERFFEALLFNHLTVSTDAHAKNYSVVHLGKGKFRLAPLYDVASLAPYLKARHAPYRVAMGIGGETRIGALRKTVLERFACTTGMDEKWLFQCAYGLIERVLAELPKVFDEPDLAQCSHIDELASRMVPRLELLLRNTERNLSRTGKDYFIPNISTTACNAGQRRRG